MKKIAIIGVDELALLTTVMLKKQMNSEIEIVCMCDTSGKRAGIMINSLKLPIVTLNDIKIMYIKWQIDAVIICLDSAEYVELIPFLYNNGIRETYSVPYYFNDIYKNNNDFVISDYLVEIDVSKPCLHYFEFHVNDHCNLNCKGCGHVSNICDEWYADIDSYKNDLLRLKELFCSVSKIKILGGEPLINSMLPEFIKATREIFPLANLYIGTNGLLIPSISEDLIEAIKLSYSWLMITPYLPTIRMKDKILDFCNEKGIKAIFNSNQFVQNFYKSLHTEKIYNIDDSFNKCLIRNGGFQCYTLRDGKIYPCGSVIYTQFLNQKFGTQFKSIEGKDFFDIYKEKDSWNLYQKLKKPIPFCAYCGNAASFAWEHISPKDAKLEDYIVSDSL